MLSNLDFGFGSIFDSVTASISGAEHINIVRQNFGFDPASGILDVPLDLENLHYYIERRVVYKNSFL